MVGCERGIGRPSRQTNRTTAEICDIGLVVISLQNSANVSNVMGKARRNEIRIWFASDTKELRHEEYSHLSCSWCRCDLWIHWCGCGAANKGPRDAADNSIENVRLV